MARNLACCLSEEEYVCVCSKTFNTYLTSSLSSFLGTRAVNKQFEEFPWRNWEKSSLYSNI